MRVGHCDRIVGCSEGMQDLNLEEQPQILRLRCAPLLMTTYEGSADTH